jgi:protein-disulfide isomerase
MNKFTGVILAILVATVAISGSLIFVGGKMGQKGGNAPAIDEQALKQQIKTELVAELQKGGNTPVIDEQALKQQLKTELLAELQKGDFLAQPIEAGIQNYVKKQQEAQIKARAEQERIANEKAKNVRRVAPDKDHIYGDSNAPVSLIEYSDFECPFCKSFHPIAKKVVEAYQGKVNWVYRHYPLPFHNPGAQKEAEASECANELGGNDAFWKYADAIYERTTSNGKGFPVEKLVPLAEELGLDKAKFQECLDSGKYTARVQDETTEGSNSGITGTPGNILLNSSTGAVKLKAGALPFEAMKAEIDQLLK